MNDWAQQIAGWHDFQLLIGTAGATLMGLTFVAVSLAPEVIADRTSTVVRAFTTPIVAFFATVLIVALILLVPQLTPQIMGVPFAVIGISGFIYVLTTGVHSQWRTLELGIDDWIWYLGLPLVAYGAMLAGGISLWFAPLRATYAVAAAMLLLLVVGIRNAWDVLLAIARQSQKQ